jgi:starch-binding outer membrane protein, SusD/RagB family
MKKIKLIYIFLLLSSVVFTSCEDFLTEKPKDFRTTNNFYVDEASLNTGLLGIYERYYSLYKAYEPFIGELGTDESVAQYYMKDYNEFYKYNLTANHNVILRWYNIHYEMIARANTIINRAYSVPNVSEAYANTVVAEARALRAWAYFRLAQTLGPLPLIVNETTSIDFNVPRSPLKDVYAVIVSDLEYAIKDGVLPVTKDKNQPGRLTQQAAKAMLGKVYLTMASAKEAGIIDKLMNKIGRQGYGYGALPETPAELYTKAQQILASLIGTAELEKKYGDVFLVEKKNNLSENIWELEFAPLAPSGSYWLKSYGVMSFPFQFERDMYTNGSGLCQIHYTTHMWKSYHEGDKRRDWNLVTYYLDYNQEPDSMQIQFDPLEGETNGIVQSWMGITKYRFNNGELKAMVPFTDWSNLPMNFAVIRYADVLLMYAEASLKANGGVATQAAVDAINQVRNRARGVDNAGNQIPESETPDFKNYTIATLTLDAILEERKLELCFESIRWFDLVRTGQLIQKYYEPVIPGDYAQGVITEDNYLFPLPQAQVDRSENKEGFFQNPGY